MDRLTIFFHVRGRHSFELWIMNKKTGLSVRASDVRMVKSARHCSIFLFSFLFFGHIL